LKKILLSICICLLSTSLAFSNINIDALGDYTQTGDLKTQYGGGGGVSYDIHRDFNIFVNLLYSEITKGANTLNKNIYSYFMALAGIQYLYQISDLPLYWTTSAGVGVSKGDLTTPIQKPTDPTQNENKKFSDSGICIAFRTGFLVHATQYLSPFFEAGYHKSFYGSAFKNENVGGLQVLVGLRYTIGTNKPLYGDY
jgi:hypothetical protein